MRDRTRVQTQRMSAGERREQILDAAMVEFARTGLHGTATETIADRAGISQPYLFRLFGTKKDLFLAAVERGFDHVEAIFRHAAEMEPENALEAMGRAYRDLLVQREELMLQLQAYAACDDPEVAAVVRQRYAHLYRLVADLSAAPLPAVQFFFAQGMLLNVAAVLDLPALADECPT